MYAFRVDDSKNLEHLFWGTQLPEEDDIQYLSHGLVPTTFDPSDHVSVQVISKALTFADLGSVKTQEDMREAGEVVTEEEDASEVHGSRLENASCRMAKHRGGVRNVNTEMDAMLLEEDPVLKKALQKFERDKRTQAISKSLALRPRRFPSTRPNRRDQ